MPERENFRTTGFFYFSDYQNYMLDFKIPQNFTLSPKSDQI